MITKGLQLRSPKTFTVNDYQQLGPWLTYQKSYPAIPRLFNHTINVQKRQQCIKGKLIFPSKIYCWDNTEPALLILIWHLNQNQSQSLCRRKPPKPRNRHWRRHRTRRTTPPGRTCNRWASCPQSLFISIIDEDIISITNPTPTFLQ